MGKQQDIRDADAPALLDACRKVLAQCHCEEQSCGTCQLLGPAIALTEKGPRDMGEVHQSRNAAFLRGLAVTYYDWDGVNTLSQRLAAIAVAHDVMLGCCKDMLQPETDYDSPDQEARCIECGTIRSQPNQQRCDVPGCFSQRLCDAIAKATNES